MSMTILKSKYTRVELIIISIPLLAVYISILQFTFNFNKFLLLIQAPGLKTQQHQIQ